MVEPLTTDQEVAAEREFSPAPWRVIQRKHTKGPLSPDKTHLDYFHIQAGDTYNDGFEIAGYMRPGDANLIAAAPELLALAKQYASECADCGGTGRIVTLSGGSGWGTGGPDAREEAERCAECEDIRAVIAKAERQS